MAVPCLPLNFENSRKLASSRFKTTNSGSRSKRVFSAAAYSYGVRSESLDGP